MPWATTLEATAAVPAATVIVVDDDQALLAALKFDLEIEGFAVIAHASGRQLEMQDLPPTNTCLVIDYHLPGINGLELLRRLRARGVRLPAILITSHPGRQLQTKVAGLGGAVIEKPLLGDALLSGIRHALASPPT